MAQRVLVVVLVALLGALPGCLRRIMTVPRGPDVARGPESAAAPRPEQNPPHVQTKHAAEEKPVPKSAPPDKPVADTGPVILQPIPAEDKKPPRPQAPRLQPLTPEQFDKILKSERPDPLWPDSAGDRKTEMPLTAVRAEKPARSAALVEALQCVLDHRHGEALQHLQSYDRKTQEFFLRLLPPIALLAQKTIEDLTASEVSVLHDQLQSLLGTLRPRTELVIDKMVFCEWVKSYGMYKPLPENHKFQAGTPSQPGELVQLYVELRNFCSEPVDEAYHVTRLTSSVEVRDGHNKLWWSYRFEGKQPLRSRSFLHDYFNNYTFHVPHLPPGEYTLTIQVMDETRADIRRTARKSLEFRVGR